MPTDHAANVLAVLSEYGAVKRIRKTAEAPADGFHVYVVTNGPEVLQIGHGNGERMKSCMRGSLAKRHNKAFICAFGEAVSGRPNEYAFIDVASKEEAERVEELVHGRLGIRTNKDAACLISGLTDDGPVSVERVNQWLWSRVVASEAYLRLSPGQRSMAEELMDLVTWGKVIERKPTHKRTTAQGDLLEGHMLAKIDKAHLIHVFQELTDGYLRYGDHKLSDEEFEARERSHHYAPEGKPFDIVVKDGRREEAVSAPPAPPRRIMSAAAPVISGARRLSPKTRLLFRRDELEGLAPDAWIEFDVVNEGTRSDPRPIDLVFRCRVRDVDGFFAADADVDWNKNGKHSWPKFPDWALKYVVRGGLG